MKIVGYEDMIVGILLGIIMIGASGRFFKLPYNDTLLIIFLFLFFILAILDIIHELKTLEGGISWTVVAVAWNIIELFIVMGHISEIYKLPFGVVTIVPFVGVVGLFGAGIFFALGNIMWLYFYITH